jgi:hypothetical protein
VILIVFFHFGRRPVQEVQEIINVSIGFTSFQRPLLDKHIAEILTEKGSFVWKRQPLQAVQFNFNSNSEENNFKPP